MWRRNWDVCHWTVGNKKGIWSFSFRVWEIILILFFLSVAVLLRIVRATLWIFAGIWTVFDEIFSISRTPKYVNWFFKFKSLPGQLLLLINPLSSLFSQNLPNIAIFHILTVQLQSQNQHKKHSTSFFPCNFHRLIFFWGINIKQNLYS